MKTIDELLSEFPKDKHFVLYTDFGTPDGEGSKVMGYWFQIRVPLVYGTRLIADGWGKTIQEAIVDAQQNLKRKPNERSYN